MQQPFLNQARSDGLILKHWRREPGPRVLPGEDAPMEDTENTEPYIENNGDYVKYRIEVDIPTFSDEEYDAYLRSDDWSREETDYLFQVIKDYSYRWAVIWDRYDYQPSANSHLTQETVNGDGQALAALPFAPPKQRTLEDIKARFYHISAKLMKLRIPEMQMDAEQYTTYEMLSKYNPEMEGNRKNLAAALMNRSMDEVKEEEFLLAELQRINMAAHRLDAEREELRARLEAPAPNQQVSAGLASFTSSQSLQALFQQLFAQDRSKKRASGGGSGLSRISLNTNDLAQTPSSASAQMSAAARRQSMATSQSAQTPIRVLSPQQEHRYNVSTHDRLTSGVTFGSDKLLKMRQAKSNVQTQKIAAALLELGISEVISLPTSRVADVFEQLIGKVSKLLDVRKVREKEEGECRVLEQMKRARGGDVQSGDVSVSNSNGTSVEPVGRREGMESQAETPMDVEGDEEENDNDGEDDGDGDGDNDGDGDDDNDVEPDAEGDEDDDEDAEGEEDSRLPSEAVSRAASVSHKRSASVLSQGSTGNKESKRARK